jgi:hypothetical protein
MLTLDRSLRLVLSVAMLTSCAVDPDEIVDDDPDLDGGKATARVVRRPRRAARSTARS